MASRLQDVLLRGTAAAKPLATAVAKGTLYYSTDTSTTEQSDGTNWNTYTDGAAAGAGKIYKVGVTIDGAGSAITTGVKGYTSIPVTGTIVRVRLLANISGSAVVDIWNEIYANYPPTVANTITAAAKPTLAAATKYEDTTLTGWITSVLAGDVLGFNVDSAATITRLTVEIWIQP